MRSALDTCATSIALRVTLTDVRDEAAVLRDESARLRFRSRTLRGRRLP